MTLMNLPLARFAHDMDTEGRRDPDLAERLARSLVVVVRGESVAATDRLTLVSAADLPDLPPSYLGTHEGQTYASVRAEQVARIGAAELLEGLRMRDFRQIGTELSDLESGLATSALALAAWQASTGFCASCSGKLALRAGGWEGVCESCGAITYPRTDPCVIMAIRDRAGRILLGRNAAWPQGRYSVIAGFIEAGESLEHAVRREVREETGIEVGEVAYRGSQAWPFPRSLMAGYAGWTEDTEANIDVDGVEMVDARFFARDELDDLVARGEIAIPRPTSIARALIDEWAAEAPSLR
ncbi:MAG: NAD(+) diphosphatase [Flaviflexus sp.]|nr:NAD(+) diphosphatase [Flaviflexus sp.]